MSERIRTFSAVLILTLVIWVWADLKLTDKWEQEVPVKVFVPPDYRVRDVTPQRVKVTFEGPKRQIEILKTTPEEMVCQLTLTGPELKTGRIALPAKEGFRYLKSRSVFSTAITDENDQMTDGKILVDLDRLVSVRVPVKVLVTGAIVAGQPHAEPTEVTATVPESDLADLPEAKRYAVARLVVSAVPQEQPVEQEVALESRLGGTEGIEATFRPPAVQVTARLESTVSSKTLTQIPILITGPPEMLNTYQVVFQEDTVRLMDLKIQGPRQSVEPLTAKDVRVELVLTPDDRPTEEGAWIPRVPKILGLPANVETVGPVPTINFNLKRRKEAPPEP